MNFHTLFCWVVKLKLYCTVSISGVKYSNGAVSHFFSVFSTRQMDTEVLLSFEFCLPESVSSHHSTLIQHFQHCQYSSPLCNGVLENVCQDCNQTAWVYPNYLRFICQDWPAHVGCFFSCLLAIGWVVDCACLGLAGFCLSISALDINCKWKMDCIYIGLF